jgi:tRNA pseudouridine55 synthase
VEAVLPRMTGDVLQRPPAYSAKKVDGQRAYAAARAGRALELEPVPVRIDELRITRFDAPELELDVACGSGTYIRAIARDLGDALGVGGHLTALRRTRVGDHGVDAAVPVAELGDAQRVRAAMIDPADALSGMPRVVLDDAQLAHIRHGRPVQAEPGDDGVVALVAGEASSPSASVPVTWCGRARCSHERTQRRHRRHVRRRAPRALGSAARAVCRGARAQRAERTGHV